MSIRELDYGNVPKMLAEAREMQESGKYINGTVFHTLADEVERLTEVNQRLLAAINGIVDAWDNADALGEVIHDARQAARAPTP